MLVITGTQRSGTSVIAAALIESGYDLGSRWFDEEAQGGYEHEIICAFYRDYLGDPTFPFDDFDLPIYPDRVEQIFADLGFEVVKFSYLLMNPVFVMIWHKFRPGKDTFLVMNRQPENVVRSKRRLWSRFQHDSTLLKQRASYLARNFNQSWHLLAELGYRTRTLHFPLCLSYLNNQVNPALRSLDPNIQIHPEAWKKVVDKTKVHFGQV